MHVKAFEAQVGDTLTLRSGARHEVTAVEDNGVTVTFYIVGTDIGYMYMRTTPLDIVAA